MPDVLDLENFKVIIQNFTVKNDVLYWYDRPIAARYSSDETPVGENYFRGGPTINVADGGTGTTSITGLVKGNGTDAFTAAILGEDYISPDSEDTLTNKTIDARETASGNKLINIGLSNFIEGLVNTADVIEGSNSLVTAGAIYSFVDTLVRAQSTGQLIKSPVVAATTEAVDLSTIKNMAVIDGVVLKTGDRVLIKDQTSSNTNGIYYVNANTAPTRTSDASTGILLMKASVFVTSGIVNKGTTWYCYNKTLTEWNTPILWMKISEFPVYSAGFGILIDNDSGIIGLDSSQVLNKDASDPIEVEYGGTGTGEFLPNSIIVSGSSDERYYKYVRTSGNRRIILSAGTDSSPYWSELIYPSYIKDRSLLYVEGGEILGLDYTPGIPLITNDNAFIISSTIPEYIKIGNDREIYHQGGVDTAVEDGGTGLSIISKDHFLYAHETNQYKETPITDFGRELVSLASVDAAKLYFGLGAAAYLDLGTARGTVAKGDHEHLEYMRIDGTTSFTAPVEGVYPTSDYHLVTKSYVDTQITGQIWQDPVLSIITEFPSEKGIGDRFLFSDSATEHAGEIAEVMDRSGTITYTSPSAGYILQNVEDGIVYIYNGHRWIQFSVAQPHNALSQLQGGDSVNGDYFHLPRSAYLGLTQGNATRLHRHSHKYLTDLQGGDGENYYHLTGEEYAAVVGLSFRYHNRLVGVQGGDSVLSEFFHLSSDQYQQLIGNQVTSIHKHYHSAAPDLKGSLDGYHLSEKSYSELLDGLVTRLHKHVHNLMDDIQGGNDTERYHLDKEYYDIVLDLKNRLKKYHNDLEAIQGGDADLDEYYHLSKAEIDGLTTGVSTSLHVHDYYIKTDGTVNFSAMPEGPDPEKDQQLATKSFVESLAASGIIWIKSVKSLGYSEPPQNTTFIPGDRYIVADPGTGEWAGFGNKIVEYSGTGWETKTLEKGMTLFVEDSSYQYMWNGEEWIIILVKQSHQSLANVFGGDPTSGYYHLTFTQHSALTGGGNCDLHYHSDIFDHASGVLPVVKGGTGLYFVPKNAILFASKDNVLETKKISDLVVGLLGSDSEEEFRKAIGLGTIATQDASTVKILGGSIEGISALGVDCGGTGLSSIPANTILFANDINSFTTMEVNAESLELLGKTKEEIADELGVSSSGGLIDDSDEDRSKLFYAIVFGA